MSSLQVTSREGTLLPSPLHDADTVWSHCTQPTYTITINQVMNCTIGVCVGVYLERRDQGVGTHLLSTAGVCQLSGSTFLRNRWHWMLPAIGNISTLEHIVTPAAPQSVDNPPKPGDSIHLVKSVYTLHCCCIVNSQPVEVSTSLSLVDLLLNEPVDLPVRVHLVTVAHTTKPTDGEPTKPCHTDNMHKPPTVNNLQLLTWMEHTGRAGHAVPSTSAYSANI